MNIAPIYTGIYNKQNIYSNNKYYSTPQLKPNNTNQLAKDTVSFTAAKFSVSVHDFWSKEIPRLKRIATTYLDAAQAVALKFADDNVSFEREMFESKAVKKLDSQILKVNRAKTFERRDVIRTTLFIKNPYDLDLLFNKIIPEFGERGYQIAPIHKSIGDLMKRGYVPIEEEKIINEFFNIPHTKEYHAKYFRDIKNQKYDYYGTKRQKYDYDQTKNLLAEYVKTGTIPNREELINLVKSLKMEVPDLDIRLNKEILNKIYDTTTLPENFRYSIGKPHGRYEDIQLRFIRDCDKKNDNPTYHELIIHFGPTYNINASDEHTWVYEVVRLFDKLRLETQNNKFNTPAFQIGGYIESIENMFRGKISNKLFANGKNADFYGIEDELKICFDDQTIRQHNNNFIILMQKIDEHYKAQRKAAKASGLACKQVDKDHKHDKKLVQEIKDKLDNTINHFNHQSGLKDNG